jgi:NAD+ diphosphatase
MDEIQKAKETDVVFMKYCIECGTNLVAKHLENEGEIPYCHSCKEYRFPVFSTAVSMIVVNQNQDKVLLIQQYNKKEFILVAGFVNKGENAEQAVLREIDEELGMKVLELRYNSSQYFQKSNTLIFNYTCIVLDEALDGITDEVDFAKWFSFAEARDNIKKDSLAQTFLENYIRVKTESN